jgi:hypothetical protein
VIIGTAQGLTCLFIRSWSTPILAPPGVDNALISEFCDNFVGESMINSNMLDWMAAVVYQDYHRDPTRQNDRFLTLNCTFAKRLERQDEMMANEVDPQRKTFFHFLAEVIDTRQIEMVMWFHPWPNHYGAVIVNIPKKEIHVGESVGNSEAYKFPKDLVKSVSLHFPVSDIKVSEGSDRF